uniref:Poly [ADP-ribose] polymerase n=1 Tax=Sinocyclocheilus grahami TaxID=75366 RepID=A0A672T2H6_SINGR
MGMCSRQERIQKDVDIVIQRCKAEKDCLFSGEFPLSLLIKRAHLLVFVFSDNTYVSNSENNDEVLVTRDPIPVIFHRIATEIRINNDATSCLSIKSKLQTDKNCHYAIEEDSEGDNDSEEFYYVGQVSSAESLHYYIIISPLQLEHQTASFLHHLGPHKLYLYGAIDDVDIDLHIDVTFLDEEIALAWDVIRSEPVIVRLHCSLTQYLNGPVPTVDVFQVSSKDRFGLGHQLKKVMQTFVTQQWKCQSKDKLISPHSKKQNEKKVKSPLHIFSTLRRICTSVIAQHLSVFLNSHCLINVLCLCKLRSPSYPPPGCVKSKKKLKPEQDGMSKSHRLLRRTCSGTVKPEMDGCVGKSHKLLGHSLSSDPRMEQHQPLKQPHRLLSRPCSTAPNIGAKSIPFRDRGFLVQTMEYAEQRIPVLNEFCVVCDEPHVFQNGPMLRPTVCERELCVFAFQTLGVMNEAADEIATGAQVVDLLVSMCRSALESPRKVVIFEPYPSVVDPNDSQALAFNPRKKDYDRVMRALDSIASFREMTQAPYLEIKKQMDKHDPLAHPLLQWVISSNRSHIVKLPVTRQLKFMHTPHQFLLLSSPPAKESNFRAAKGLFGSTFAFHGSHIENWHSILRNGLVVASNTRLQLHGAIYGSGIYLSPLSSISFGYSGMNKKQQKVASKDETAANKSNINLQSQKKGQNPQFLQSRNLKCIALCEGTHLTKIYTIICNFYHVNNHFFFIYIYEDGQVGDTSINTQDPGIHREILRVIGNQTATG